MRNDNPMITHTAPAILAILIQPTAIMLKITNPGRTYMKQAFFENLLWLIYRWFSIIRKGTRAINKISPEHQPVQANPERMPPVTDNATSLYLFIA